MLAPEFLPVWGGAGTYTVELIKHLPRDTKVHIVTPMRESYGKQKAPESDSSDYFGSNIRIHYISRARDTFTYNASFQYACFKYVPKLLKSEQIDILHSHTAHMPDLLLRLRRFKTPTIVTVHNTIRSQRLGTQTSNQRFNSLERSEKAVSMLYPALRVVEDLYFHGSKHLIAPSNWMKERIARDFRVSAERGAAVHVIPNSVDVESCRRISREARSSLCENIFRTSRVVLYCGRLLAYKGVDLLIHAIPRIVKDVGDELLFVFIGPGNPDIYAKRLERLGVPSKNYLFMGPVSRTESLRIMGCAELMILPSYLENCPYAVIEAMACELPVIASDVGGIPEMIQSGYNGLTFRPGCSIELSEKTIRLLQDRSMQRKMSQRALEIVSERFSWSANLPRQLQAYAETMC